MRYARGLVIGAGIALLNASVGRAESASAMLEKAIFAEETKGDLDEAIKIYRQIVDEAARNRPFVAQALYRLGMCHLKKGEKDKARQEFQDLLASYPQEKVIAALAQKELAKLMPAGGLNLEFLPLNTVVERTVNDDGVGKDFIIDFDTGTLYTPTAEDRNARIRAQDLWDRGFDAGAETAARGPGLYCGDMIVIPLASERWEDLALDGIRDDIAMGKPGTPVVMSALPPLPRSYVFKTREGSIGALQILELLQAPPRGIKIRYKLLEYDPAWSSDTAPHVVKTSPPAFADDIDPALDKVTVTFDQEMMDQSWSWTGGGDTYPKVVGKIHYDPTRRTCTLPVALEPGHVYWIGINSPSHRNFKTPARVPARRYVILFATKTKDGKPTPIPQDMLANARAINSPAQTRPTTKPSAPDKEKAADLVSQGWALLQQSKFAEAEKLFGQAVQMDPAGPNTWNGLGWAQFNQGKRLDAKASFEKCLALPADPSHAAALNGLAWIAKGQNKIDDAVAYWNKALAIMPSATAALYGLATTSMERGEYEKSIDYYTRLLKYEPGNADAKAGLEKAAAASKAVKSAMPVAKAWLAHIDAQDYAAGWDRAASFLKSATKKEDFTAAMKAARSPLGKPTTRRAKSAQYATSLPGAPDGQYVVIQFDASFENKKQAVETITPMNDKDGQWRVSGYYVK